jgi:hypothetical protein
MLQINNVIPLKWKYHSCREQCFICDDEDEDEDDGERWRRLGGNASSPSMKEKRNSKRQPSELGFTVQYVPPVGGGSGGVPHHSRRFPSTETLARGSPLPYMYRRHS